jgi:hypothetical protein
VGGGIHGHVSRPGRQKPDAKKSGPSPAQPGQIPTELIAPSGRWLAVVLNAIFGLRRPSLARLSANIFRPRPELFGSGFELGCPWLGVVVAERHVQEWNRVPHLCTRQSLHCHRHGCFHSLYHKTTNKLRMAHLRAHLVA